MFYEWCFRYLFGITNHPKSSGVKEKRFIMFMDSVGQGSLLGMMYTMCGWVQGTLDLMLSVSSGHLAESHLPWHHCIPWCSPEMSQEQESISLVKVQSHFSRFSPLFSVLFWNEGASTPWRDKDEWQSPSVSAVSTLVSTEITLNKPFAYWPVFPLLDWESLERRNYV